MSDLIEKFDEFADSLLGKANNLRYDSDKAAFEQGWRYGKGKAFRVVRPSSEEQLSKILHFCDGNGIKLILQGGNTGLVGASVPDMSGEQVIVSTSLLLNKHIVIDNNVAEVGAGVVLDSLNDYLHKYGLCFPIDIASSGSCTIGGMIATNAAGTRAAKYGNIKQRLLDITVACANGDIKEVAVNAAMQQSFQDNSRVDFDNPFVGSSGWLGVIVKARVKLAHIALSSASSIILPKEDSDILRIMEKCQEIFGDNLSAFEVIAKSAMDLAANSMGVKVFDEDYDYAILLEISSDDAKAATDDVLGSALEELLEGGLIVNARYDKPDLFWQVRHNISDAMRDKGKVLAFDISMLPAKLVEFRREMKKLISEDFGGVQICSFGHEMIGAMHYNLLLDEGFSDNDINSIRELVYDVAVQQYGGSFSAEHNIGPSNQEYYDKYTSREVKNKCYDLKRKYDPNNTLNPNISYGY